MRVERVTEPDDDLARAVARLVPQLSPHRPAPGLVELAEIAAAPGTAFLVARDEDGSVVGMLTLITYRVPTGLRGWIHDVVVDEGARGRGAGEALTREALELARSTGVATVHLTSRVQREAANRLYARLGFERYETNVYVWRPQ
ncbi:MAG TPA: GNAT family N-acetyltransferase [Gaiellaceae bacterium]|jgi:ribosomal protein S18 acetylase RimI-like enzyme|nr:GNAT family N-acetyltransferase [Gaiellaceae bacterium]